MIIVIKFSSSGLDSLADVFSFDSCVDVSRFT